MNPKRHEVLAGGRLALVALLLVACGIGLFWGCAPPQRTVDFVASSVEGLPPLPVVFTLVAGADAVSFAWDFGDGGTSEEPTPVHVYREGGTYAVTLTVVFADGATASVTKSDLIQVASGRVQPGFLYWIGDGGAIWRGARDGSFKEMVVTGVAGARTLAIDAGKLYWTVDQGNGRIERANLDGTSRQTLVNAVYRPRGLAIDPRHGKMYWTTYPTPPYSQNPKTARAMRANLDGTNVEEIYDFSVPSPGQERCGDAIAVDPMADKLLWVYQLNDVYFFDSSGEECRNELQSARTDDPSPFTLRGNLCYVADLVLDLVANAPALHMYWISWMGSPVSSNALVRANPNAETENVLVTGIDGGTSLDVDVAQGTLFWSDKAGIHRANLDGTSATLVFPGVAAESIALER